MFRGLVSPRNCLWILFWPRVSLGAVLATVRLQHSGRLSGIKQAYSVLTLIVYKNCCLYHTDLQSTLTLIVYKTQLSESYSLTIYSYANCLQTLLSVFSKGTNLILWSNLLTIHFDSILPSIYRRHQLVSPSFERWKGFARHARSKTQSSFYLAKCAVFRLKISPILPK